MEKLSVKIPFSGFYNSSHDAEFDRWLEQQLDYLASEYNVQSSDLEKYSDFYYSAVDWRKVHEAYAKEYVSEVETLLETEGGRKIALEYEALQSPREYNFETDCIYAKVALVDLQYMLAIIPTGDWEAFVREKCTSYSGFISFYPSDYAEWDKDVKTWGEARTGMILEAYLIHILAPKDINDVLSSWELMERPFCNGFIDNLLFEYSTEEFNNFDAKLRG